MHTVTLGAISTRQNGDKLNINFTEVLEDENLSPSTKRKYTVVLHKFFVEELGRLSGVPPHLGLYLMH